MKEPILETGKLELSDHGYKRMLERLPEQSKNKISALNHARSLLKNSKYIGIVPDKDGKASHMYVFNKEIVIHVSLDLKTVATIYEDLRESEVQFLPFRKSVENIYKKELRKIHRSEMATIRKLNYLVSKNEVEIAQLKFRKFKTRSHTVKTECDKMIVKLSQEIWELDSKVKHIQMDKRRVAYAIASESY